MPAERDVSINIVAMMFLCFDVLVSNQAIKLFQKLKINNMNPPMKVNRNELERTNSKKIVPDTIISAAEANMDIVRGLDVGMVEGADDPPIAAAAKSGGGTSVEK